MDHIRPHVQILPLAGRPADEVAGDYLNAIGVLAEDVIAVRRRTDDTGLIVAVSVIHQDRPRYAAVRKTLAPCSAPAMERPPDVRLTRRQLRARERKTMLHALAGLRA